VAERITYRSAGVNAALKESLIPLFRRLARPTISRQVIGGIGGFGALFALDGAKAMRSPVLVAGTDQVGTKTKIATATGRHDTVGIDCVAMCVNDIICHAARPLFFLDYIATGKLERRVALDIVKGIARGCRQAGASLVGGETGQLPGLYQPGEYDLSGTAVGIVERSKIPSPKMVRPGDALIGLASNGLHSNGFSLVRRILLERAKLKLDAYVPELRRTLGEELLRPTTIYARIALELFERFRIKGLAHITGGGLIENVPRVMPDGVVAAFRRGSWTVPPIFEMVQRLGKLSRAEMDHTFNNGIGMVAIVNARDVDAILVHLRRRKCEAYLVGEVRRGARGVSFA
jgi:phosphoribosylformylglycinamidine cyclo-ligase